MEDHADFISILIPAKNEEDKILDLLFSIQNQDYPHYEVIILDDQSSDQTFSLVTQFSKLNPKFRIIQGSDLPTGWLGKNYACHQLALEAKGDYFLFLDADVTIHDELLSKALTRMKSYPIRNQGHTRNKESSKPLALLSLFAGQDMKSLGEWLTVPLMNYFLLSFLPIPFIKTSEQETLVAANGQFMLFTKLNYENNYWHSKVRHKVAEDYEIAKLMKKNHLKVETLLGNGLLQCRMYKGFSEGYDGFTKNTYALFNYNLVGIVLFLFMISGSYISILIFPSWIFGSAVLFLVLGTRILTSVSSGQNVILNILLHPFQIIVMIYITLQSIIKYYRNTLFWKGRKLNLMLSDQV